MMVPRVTAATRFSLAVLALAFVLVACGGQGEDNSSSPEAASTISAATGSSAAGAPTTTPQTSSTTPAGRTRLEILAPKDEQVIKLPAEFHYRVSGVDVEKGFRLRLMIRDLRPFEIPLTEQAGVITVPDEKSMFLPGRRDLTFQLIASDGRLLGAPVTVRDLTIEGRRTG